MMNLKKLFEIQAKLDEHIVKEKGLEGQDLLDEKILALQVELGELANEWRGFKFWSENQKPKKAYNKGCEECVGGISKISPLLGPYKKCDKCRINPMLEEYVDCLHFILSIGLDYNVNPENSIKHINDTMNWNLEDRNVRSTSITEQFNIVFANISYFHQMVGLEHYYDVATEFFILGEKLSFTDKQVEQAYLEKNKINHERQMNGY